MIERKQGDILGSEADALVNTVNCVGVMGKGIALQFRQAFPKCYAAYRRACDANELALGRMHVFETGSLVGPKYIINFPTKRHWKGKSRIGDIANGLDALREFILKAGIQRIALPPLGCGNGGLDWGTVKRLIEEKLSGMDGVAIELYEPAGAPPAKSMTVATEKPNMTRGRAALLAVFGKYLAPGYELSMLEIQKLAYFLQEAGEPLRLNFEKRQYGPYAEVLHHVLQRIEGHFIRGYGDRSRDASVEVLGSAMNEAEKVLAGEYPDTLKRVNRVNSLIEGFETPYGLELLSTMDWVMKRESGAAGSFAAALAAFKSWNERKASIFPEKHIRLAWDHLLAANGG